MMIPRNSILRRTLLLFLGVLVPLGLWAVIAALQLVSPFYLPSPAAVLKELLNGEFWATCGSHLGITMLRAACGYAIAAVVAVPLGLAIGRLPVVRYLSSPAIEFLRPLPASAVIPIALLFLGLGSQMQIAVVAFGQLGRFS
jgi:ABC-type nitrate/sulfonate/bicarbonate transport system permease component